MGLEDGNNKYGRHGKHLHFTSLSRHLVSLARASMPLFCFVQLQEPQQILAGPSKEGACQVSTCKVSRSFLDLLM